MKSNHKMYLTLDSLGADYDSLVDYRPELAKAVTFALARKQPIHSWFYYKQGFSPYLVEIFIRECGLSSDAWVLDPFCGVGTTLLTSKSMGINCIGIDILPLAVFVSKVKLRNDFDPSDIEKELVEVVIENRDKPVTKFPSVRVLDRAFSEQRKNEILVYKERIQQIEKESTRELLLLCLLSILGESSKTKKDGGFLRIIDDATERPLKPLFENKVNEVLRDIRQRNFSATDSKAMSKVIEGDARSTGLESESIDCIITSPPYLNKTDYTRIYSLELCLGFIDSFEQLKQIRYNCIRSNVEARYKPQNISLPFSLIEPLKTLQERHLSNPKHPEMIRGYFEDIKLSLAEMKRLLKNKGRIYFVVWNSCFSGVNFDVDRISSDLGKDVGLNIDRIIVARQKGTSAQQIEKYGERPLRESVVVFSKR